MRHLAFLHFPNNLTQAAVTAAIVYFFAQATVTDVLAQGRFPLLAALSAAAEQLPAFRAAPHGDGSYPVV